MQQSEVHVSRGQQTLIKCQVSITTEGGEQTYDGLFPSTTDAVIDAQTRIGMQPCKVSVKAIQ